MMTLLPCHRSAVAVGLYSPTAWCRYVLVVSHVLLAASLWKAASATDAASSPSLTATYMFVWKLFYAEYCLLPLFGR
jgi:homogentisate phytyltransferase/homogentisate geranylgeranyltransferase